MGRQTTPKSWNEVFNHDYVINITHSQNSNETRYANWMVADSNAVGEKINPIQHDINIIISVRDENNDMDFTKVMLNLQKEE